MQIRYTTILLAILFSITSFGQLDANKQIDEGNVKNDIYSSEEIGWTIRIPQNWEVVSREVNEKHRKKGEEALENTLDKDIDLTGLKNLIGFQKNQLNIFKSTSEPFEPNDKAAWEESSAFLKEQIYNTFLNQGIEVDATETKIVKVDGLDFYAYEFIIYSPKGDVILNQLVYGRLINGFDFGVTLIYNNEADKKEMLDSWLNSKFRK